MLFFTNFLQAEVKVHEGEEYIPTLQKNNP